MKKTIVVLTFFIIFILSACSAAEQESGSANQEEASSSIQSDVSIESTQENASDDEITESGDTQETEESGDIELPLDETVFIDDETCLLKISGSAYITGSRIKMPVEWENRSEDRTYIIYDLDATVYVNGLLVYGSFRDNNYRAELEPGESDVVYYYIDISELEESGVTEYTDIALTFVVSSDDIFDTIGAVSGHIYPYGEENATQFVRESQDTDQVLVENEDFALIATDSVTYIGERIWSIPIYLINKTDHTMKLFFEDTMVNGDLSAYSVLGVGSTGLETHSSAFGRISVSFSSSGEITDEELDSLSVESITFLLKVYGYSGDGSEDLIYEETLTVSP